MMSFPCVYFQCININMDSALKRIVLPIYTVVWEITKYIDSSIYPTQANILHIKYLMIPKGKLQCIRESLHLTTLSTGNAAIYNVANFSMI